MEETNACLLEGGFVAKNNLGMPNKHRDVRLKGRVEEEVLVLKGSQIKQKMAPFK